jgi:hypothetical protein
MIPKVCNRLGQRESLIAAASKHSAQERFIQSAHPDILHLANGSEQDHGPVNGIRTDRCDPIHDV